MWFGVMIRLDFAVMVHGNGNTGIIFNRVFSRTILEKQFCSRP